MKPFALCCTIVLVLENVYHYEKFPLQWLELFSKRAFIIIDETENEMNQKLTTSDLICGPILWKFQQLEKLI